MQYYELALYDRSLTEEDIRQHIFLIADRKINGISLYSKYVPLAKDLLPPETTIAGLIDISCAIGNELSNSVLVKTINRGANAIDYVANQLFISNKEWDELHEDLTVKVKICNERKVDFRLLLESRYFDEETLNEIVSIIKDVGIEYVVTSYGDFNEDLNDNLITSMEIKKKSKISVIATANIWTPEHIALIKKTKIYGFRFKSANTIKNLFSGVLSN